MEGFGLTGWAVVVAGQDCTLVVTEALPVIVVTIADSGAGRGEAVGDDAVGDVSWILYAIARELSHTRQWQCRSQIASHQKQKRLLRSMWWTVRRQDRRRPGRWR